MEQSIELGAIISIAKRRYALFVIPAAVVFVLAGLLAYFMPRSYESKAVILIEAQRIPTELASSTVTASPRERINLIEQRLLARDNLLEIADKYSLYKEDGADPSPTTIVDNMRKAIVIDQIDVARQSRRNTEIVGFNVSFQYPSATMSARVANELVTSILSQNLETRLARAAETSDFFEQQLQDLEAKLLGLESKKASFKRDNEEVLPETLPTRREELSEINVQIGEIDLELSIVEQGGNGAAGEEAAIAQQLTYRLQSQQLNYDSFVARRDLLGPLAEKGYVSKKTMSDLDRQITQTEIEIASIRSQMLQHGVTVDPAARSDVLKNQRDALQSSAQRLKESISLTPAVEVELAAMEREYENLRAEFMHTKAKLTDAQIGERLEQDRQAERFEILEQATVPEAPTKPNRLKIMLGGAFGAVVAGLGVALLVEMLDTSIRTARDLERHLQLRPIAIIPYVVTSKERWRRRRVRFYQVVVFVTLLTAVFALLDHYYLPLDLFVERIQTKIGAQFPGVLQL
ncbi:MAG: hypothetical protein AAGA50_12835 [Pseudomonadota bacterium]